MSVSMIALHHLICCRFVLSFEIVMLLFFKIVLAILHLDKDIKVVFDKHIKVVQWKKHSLFYRVPEQLDIHMTLLFTFFFLLRLLLAHPSFLKCFFSSRSDFFLFKHINLINFN